MSTEWIQSKRESKTKRKPRQMDLNMKKIKELNVLNVPASLDLALSPLESMKEGFEELTKEESTKEESTKEGFTTPHIFQDIPILKYVIFALKHIFDLIQYTLQYISIQLVHIASHKKGDAEEDSEDSEDTFTKEDINIVYNMLYFTLSLVTSFYFLYNWYYITIFCNNDDSVRSALANGKVTEVTEDFFYKLFGVTKKNGLSMGESIVGMINFFFIHAMFPAIVIFTVFLHYIPYIANIFLSNKAIFVLLHLLILYTITVHGTQIKELYMSLFNQNTAVDSSILTLVTTLITISIIIKLYPFSNGWFSFFGRRISIVTVVLIFLLFLIQVVFSFLLAHTAVFFLAFFLIFYSLFSILTFADISETMEKVAQIHLDDIPENERFSIFQYHTGNSIPTIPSVVSESPISKLSVSELSPNESPAFPTIIPNVQGLLSTPLRIYADKDLK